MRQSVTTRKGSLRSLRLFGQALAPMLCALLVLPAASSAESVTITGYTEAYLDSKLGIGIPGRVANILVREGSSVEKGQVLLELDQDLEKIDEQRRLLIWKSKAEIEAAAKRVQTVEPQLKSTKQLYTTTGSVSREELENQELEYSLAQSEHKRLDAAEQREELEYGIASEEVKRRTLRAPFDGKVAELLIRVGENCELDTPLMRLVNVSRVYFIANVELSVSQMLKTGKLVELQFQDGGNTLKRKGEVTFISPVVDPASGLRKVKVVFDNQGGKVIPGITGTMRLNSE